jgi:hypothetical protein
LHYILDVKMDCFKGGRGIKLAINVAKMTGYLPFGKH